MRLNHLRGFVDFDADGAQAVKLGFAAARRFRSCEHHIDPVTDQFLVRHVDGQTRAGHFRRVIAARRIAAFRINQAP